MDSTSPVACPVSSHENMPVQSDSRHALPVRPAGGAVLRAPDRKLMAWAAGENTKQLKQLTQRRQHPLSVDFQPASCQLSPPAMCAVLFNKPCPSAADSLDDPTDSIVVLSVTEVAQRYFFIQPPFRCHFRWCVRCDALSKAACGARRQPPPPAERAVLNI